MFFKSHIEPNGAIDEYYNTTILLDAGYNVVLPLHVVREPTRQIAFYPKVLWPVIFDLARQIERGEPSDIAASKMLDVEKAECGRLLGIYRSTALRSSPEVNAKAPVHQLFWHRLVNRFQRFYGSAELTATDGQIAAMPQLLAADWTINSVEQPRTLGQLMNEAQRVLDPEQPALTAIGHGDAHYGNVFLESQKDFLYFDPAFAGRHSPLLDVAKPLFHNVFAQWMYFPKESDAEGSMAVNVGEGHIDVEYSSSLPPLRQGILDIKRGSLIQPLAAWLEDEGGLTSGLRPLELALMCCSLLTMNLADKSRFPGSVGWFGMALAVQMGNWDVEQVLPSPDTDRAASLLSRGSN